MGSKNRTSASKKLRYARGAQTSAKNKIRRLKKHLKRQPNDRQSRIEG